MNRNVETYFTDGCMRCSLGATPECKVHKWSQELRLLRNIALDSGLTEECKWGVPCYTHKGTNIAMVSAFKEYAALSFFKGALLRDEQKLLDKPGENSQSARLFKFTSPEQIKAIADTVKAYLFEAIEAEEAGLKVVFAKNPEPMPEELQQALDDDPAFKSAFEDLTPGRQRSYIIHIGQAKQAKTRHSRVEKCMPKIFKGKGFNEY